LAQKKTAQTIAGDKSHILELAFPVEGVRLLPLRESTSGPGILNVKSPKPTGYFSAASPVLVSRIGLPYVFVVGSSCDCPYRAGTEARTYKNNQFCYERRRESTSGPGILDLVSPKPTGYF